MRYIWFGIFALILAQCAQLQSDFRDAAIIANGGGNCRTYATGYINAGNMYTCSWNGAAFQYICSGNGNVYTYQYPSLKKFIEETKVFGRTFITSTTITGSGPSITTYTYDLSERLAAMTITAAGSNLAYNYTTFDSQGRPTAGIYNASVSGIFCTNAIVTQSYNDSARTASFVITGGTGLLCTTITSTSTYDAETSVATTSVTTPGGTTTNSITGKAKVCI